MESISLLRGGATPKLLFKAPSFTTPSRVISCLRFDLGNKAPFSRFSKDSTNTVSIGSIRNLDRCNRLLARCGNVHGSEEHSDATRDSLKSLLSLVQPNKGLTSAITLKNEALKLVVDKKYDEAERHMKDLCNGVGEEAYEARVAHVQILIHLDEYKKALQFLENNFSQSELLCQERLCLCKAVLHTMLGNDYSPENSWDNYLETLGNANVSNEKYLQTHCENMEATGSSVNHAKDLLKPLLSLKPAEEEEENSVHFNITPIKNKALKEVVNGEYVAAEGLMEQLCKDAKARDGQEGLESAIAYIHILIYLEKYKEALQVLTKIQNLFSPSDARHCLYMAIGLTGLGNHKDARISWKAFMKSLRGIPKPNDEK